MARQNQSADKITDALISLMSMRDYASISISDITSLAEVSRSCFYRNFTTKEDILNRFISRVALEIEQMVHAIPAPGIFDYFLTLFRGMARYSSVVGSIYKANLGSLMLDRFNEMLSMKPLHLKTGDQPGWEYRRRFYTGAFYNVLMDWILNGMKESPENMASTCCALAFA